MRVLTEDNIDQIASMSFSTTALTLGGAANLIRENKAALGTTKLPRVSASPDADNRPALRPVKEGEGEGEEDPAKVAESLGWQFVNFEANGGEVYQSLIRDERGAPTQMWSVQQHGGKYPTEHPSGWNAQMLYYNDGVPIKAEAVVDLLERMPYANNFALAVQDIRDAQSEAALTIPMPLSPAPLSPGYEPMSPQPMMQQQQPQQPQQQQPQSMMMMQSPQPMMMQSPQPMMMQSPQPMMMVPMMQSQPQPMMMMQSQQLQQQQQPPISTTGAKAAELIKEQLHPVVTETGSMLDVAPEVKPASSSTSESASESSEGKRVIKLS
jgi:hypothetical protein